MTLTIERIREAARFLEGRIRKTPMEPCPRLEQLLGQPVYLKLENLQVTGSFKVRGAYFKLSRLSEETRARGVVTCSAGNHGKGVAYAARKLGIPVTIYVPATVDASKYEGMIALGAEVVRSHFDGYDDTECLAREEASRRGREFISAFEDLDIMAGNGGTLGMEILEEVPDVANLLFPISGGGLGAGLAVYATHLRPDVKMIACQHKSSPALALSLQQGRAVNRMPGIKTLAGGIEGGIGTANFELLKTRVSHVMLASEVEILRATRWLLENHQYLVEPSGAVTVAGCLYHTIPLAPGPIVLVLSGRNVSLEGIRAVLAT